MYDYGLSTLEQYGLTAESTARTRGGLLCRTEKGLVIVRNRKKTTETTGITSADPESGRQGGLLYSKSGRKSGQPRP